MRQKKRWLSLLALLLVLVPFFNVVGTPGVVSAGAVTTSDDIREELEQLEKDSEKLENEIKELQDQLNSELEGLEALVNEKNVMDQEIVKLYEQIDLINDQINTCSRLIAQKQEELDAAEAKLKELQQENKLRIRAMEENGELSYWTVLVGANSFVEFLDRWEMVEEIAKADNLCLEALETAAAQVAEAKEAMVQDQAVLQEKREYIIEVEEQLEIRREETDELLIEMKAQADEYAAMIEESEAMQEELMSSIEFKQEEYEELKKKEEEQAAANRPSSPVIGGSTNTIDGITWTMPCTYWRMSSPFGYRYHPISGIWKMHNGVDLTGPQGTPIVATRSGYVTTAAYQAGGAGYYVSINHGDGFGSIYMHMTHFVVSYGQYVEAGQVIGYMGTTGGSTGVHLHFGISYNGVYVNPADYINIV